MDLGTPTGSRAVQAADGRAAAVRERHSGGAARVSARTRNINGATIEVRDEE